MERSENTRKLSQILWGIGILIAVFGLVQVIRGESTEGFSGLTAGFTVILTAVYIRLRDIQLRQTEVLEQSNVIHQGSLEVQRKLASLQEATQALLTRARELRSLILLHLSELPQCRASKCVRLLEIQARCKYCHAAMM